MEPVEGADSIAKGNLPRGIAGLQHPVNFLRPSLEDMHTSDSIRYCLASDDRLARRVVDEVVAHLFLGYVGEELNLITMEQRGYRRLLLKIDEQLVAHLVHVDIIPLALLHSYLTEVVVEKQLCLVIEGECHRCDVMELHDQLFPVVKHHWIDTCQRPL